jgi:hypothetical protein
MHELACRTDFQVRPDAVGVVAVDGAQSGADLEIRPTVGAHCGARRIVGRTSKSVLMRSMAW